MYYFLPETMKNLFFCFLIAGLTFGGIANAASEWESKTYEAGDQILYQGKIYECKPYPYSGWCGQREPGSNGWEEAWQDTGETDTDSGSQSDEDSSDDEPENEDRNDETTENENDENDDSDSSNDENENANDEPETEETSTQAPDKPSIAWLPGTDEDGDFLIVWNLWWGENGDNWQLLENETVIFSDDLTPSSPQEQTGSFDIKNKPNGTYEYQIKLCLSTQCTTSEKKTIRVERNDNPVAEDPANNDDSEGSTDETSTENQDDSESGASVPGIPNIAWMSSENRDGDFPLLWNMWWGTNGTYWILEENGAEILQKDLSDFSPFSQFGFHNITGKATGKYEYQVRLCNEEGCSTSQSALVNVNRTEDSYEREEENEETNEDDSNTNESENASDEDEPSGNENENSDSDLDRIVASTQTREGTPVVDLENIENNYPNVQRVKGLVSREMWDYIFPVRNEVYNYEEFLKAIGKFPALCNEKPSDSGESLDEICARELATIFAHATQETGGHAPSGYLPGFDDPVDEWRQGLYYLRELGCSQTGAGCEYTGGTCEAGTWQNDTWPCAPGQKYYGRGAKQLSYNYNYGPFSRLMFGGVETLLEDADRVAREGWLAVSSAIWFYMTPQSPKPSMHDVVAGFWEPNSADLAAGIEPGFGATTNIINGGIECGPSEKEDARSENRIKYYKSFMETLGATAGENLGCKDQARFPGGGSGAIPTYWERDWSADGKCKLVSYQTAFSLWYEEDYDLCVQYHFGGNDSEEEEIQEEELPPEETENTEENTEEEEFRDEDSDEDEENSNDETESENPDETETDDSAPEESSEPPKTENSDSRRIIGYFPEWGVYSRNYHIADIPGEKLTHINYSFAKIENGEVAIWDEYAFLQKHYSETDTWDGSQGVNDKGNRNQIRVLRDRFPHLKFLISVGGWTGSAEFSSISATSTSRQKFARSAREFVETHGFDGVDIDWEFPVIGGAQPGMAEDKRRFTLLMQALRDELGEEYLLSAAMSANPDGIDAIEYDQVAPLVDWLTIMSYDFHGSWENRTGHNSPLFNNADPVNSEFNISSSIKNILATGFPRAKLVPGVAFYGRSWANVGNAAVYSAANGAGPGTFEDGVLDYKDIARNYLTDSRWEKFWDEEAKSPYLYNSSQKQWISYDDSRSIQARVEYFNQENLGGVMFWELSGDNGDLLEAIVKNLK